MICEFGYQGLFPGEFRDVLGGGRMLIVAVPQAGPLPDFHLTPRDHEWHSLMPQWPALYHVGPVVMPFGTGSTDPEVRGWNWRGLRSLFSPDRLEALGDLSGWTVDCADGHLLLYRERDPLQPESVPALVRRALAIAGVLTTPEEIMGLPTGRAVRAQRAGAQPGTQGAGGAWHLGPAILDIPDELLRGFLSAIHAEVEDDGQRLILADWLEDEGDARAEMVRLSCQRDALPHGDPRWQQLDERLSAWDATYRAVWLGQEQPPYLTVRGYERGLLALSVFAPDAEACVGQSEWPGFASICEQGWVTSVSFTGTDETFDLLPHAWPVVESADRLRLKGLESLTDRGLRDLHRLSRLRQLDLGECGRLTDAVLAELLLLPWLESLDLSGCDRIGDSALLLLGSLGNLRRLLLPAGRDVPEAVRAALREALPHCQVV